jgi:magnesium transporter
MRRRAWASRPRNGRPLAFGVTIPPREPALATRADASSPAPAHAHEEDAERPAARDEAHEEAGEERDGARVRARRFDADRSDEVLELDDALAKSPSERQLLWIDITGPMPEGLVARLTEAFSLDDTTAEALDAAGSEPVLTVHGSYLHVRVAAEPDPERPRDSPWLAVVAAPNAVITFHELPITFLDDLDDQVQADAAYGLLDSQSFLATLLHVAVTSYHGAIDRIEDDIERLDDRSLRDRGGRRMLNELVEVRSRIASLRRLLAKHRYVYGALSGVVLGDTESEASTGNLALSDVSKAYADAMIAVEGARELVLGSFNVYATRTAQRTNDTMKVLTLVTVLLLPGSLIAGLLGMNVIVPLDKDNPLSFWFVLGGVALLAVVIVLIARRRGWM